uniref:aralkylamine N-acetyltransferase n=1 Tax=Antheraea pernyi TaxID=7119 RepID=A2SZ52_ANTPE|nr:arylalkylamine N-acetyltransferase [Antheraea pernyi]
MAVTSDRNFVGLKEKGHFEQDNARIEKYTLADELPEQLATLNLRPRVMTQPSYTIQRLSAADKDLVLKFLRRFFFRDEPMNLAVNLLETPESRCMELEDYASTTLDEGVSVAAVDENGDFVGVIINGIVRREEVDYTDKSAECPNPKFRRILRVLGHLDREAKIWEKLPECCHSVLEIRIASTHSAWRGRGLMRVLCEESERLAKALGAGALRMDTTSAFSAAAAERLSYKKIYSTLYSDLDYAPHPDAPHLEASVYIKEI